MPSDNPYRDMLDLLKSLDPDLADSVWQVLDRADPPIATEAVGLLVDDTLWGIAREESFGRVIAAGYLKLFDKAKSETCAHYHDLVRAGGDRGTTVGRLLAIHLVPIMIHGGPAMLERFLTAVKTMESKGTYTLLHPLEAVSELLDSGDKKSATIFLELLINAFDADLNYNQCQHLSRWLPRAARKFVPQKRNWQLEQLLRVIRSKVYLGEAYLSGMDKGLQLLAPAALKEFVAKALDISSNSPESARCFLALESQRACEIFKEMQVAVSLCEMQPQFNRYLRARTGCPISVRPSSSVAPKPGQPGGKLAETCSDGRFIYLPDEIAVYDTRAENAALYRCLVRFEIGCHEFGTYDFDLDRLQDQYRGKPTCPDLSDGIGVKGATEKTTTILSDLDRFFGAFPAPALASDLFTIFEHGRIRCHISRYYPGVVRTYLPILQQEAHEPNGLLSELYAVIALGVPIDRRLFLADSHRRLAKKIVGDFDERFDASDLPVETSGEMVLRTYDDVAAEYGNDTLRGVTFNGNSRLDVPCNRQLRPDLVIAASMEWDRKALFIQKALEERGYRAYRADIRNTFQTNKGVLTTRELEGMIKPLSESSENRGTTSQILDPNFTQLLADDIPGVSVALDSEEGESCCPTSWYREWDCQLGDYLNDHTRVRDRQVSGYENHFYRRTIDRHRGLVGRIRYSFELLKPEGLRLCRRWIEGDEFDYKALIDFILEKRAGRTPSERLYLKRLKEIRDVAVLLLVDLSRSTKNAVAGSTERVLDVEKEAIVLLSEALEVVGDAYAIAGFSGSGRLGVDYYHIKDFGEPMNVSVRQRINAMMPQRNTRMGAAIRHAAAQFDAVPSRVRLLIILGDGYPNDLDYKKEYAIEDTRRAISELRSQHIYVHAITVHINPADNARLDTLYGEIHHNVITNVFELPDKLWRIYGALTR